jgi:hypothetical protein
MNIYYVYVYRHPTTNIPFYVGMGKKDRYLSHLKEAIKHPTPVRSQGKLNTIRKIIREGSQPVIQLIDTKLSKEDAIELEIFLIELIGRKDLKNGSLTNLTSGGDGYSGWSDFHREEQSNRMKTTIAVKNPVTGEKFRVSDNDPRWLSGELVGQNLGECNSNINGKLDGYIQAKDKNGNIFRIKPTDPRWLSGELVGINKNRPAHENTKIAASKTHKGVPKSKEHNKKVSESTKGSIWIHNFDTGKTSRLTKINPNIPNGFVIVCGPHKLLTLEQREEERITVKNNKKQIRSETALLRKQNNSLAQKQFRKDNPFFGLTEKQIQFSIEIVELFSTKPTVPLIGRRGNGIRQLSYIRAFSLFVSKQYNVTLHTIHSIVNGKKPNLIHEIIKIRPDLSDICQEILQNCH